MKDDAWSDDSSLLSAGRRAYRELPEVPEAVRRRAELVTPAATGLLNTIRATLAVDSWVTPLPALRSAAETQRQLLFSTETQDVDVRLTRTDLGWTLEGQVLGPCDGASLCAQRGADSPVWASLDELGAFRLTGMRDGRYDLVLYVGTDRVELAQVDLSPRGTG